MAKILRGIGIFFLVVIVIAIAVYAFFAIRSQPMAEHPFFAHFEGQDVIVMAHQGGDGERPSNTMMAFEHAAELGVDVLEMDVHMTVDGVLVVIHDATIDRTTDGTGAVKEMSLEEVQSYDAGYNWPTLSGHPDAGTFPYRGQGITIPSLEEVFQTFPDYPMSIEIKQREPSIAQALCELIREYEREDLTIVPSFREDAMYDFREACPEVASAGVESEVRQFYTLNLLYVGATWQPETESFMLPEYSGDTHVLTEAFIRGAKQHNVRVYAWTINTEEDAQRLIDIGIEGLITDYPSMVMELLGE